jgi:RNA methyltransferase, TrmH family
MTALAASNPRILRLRRLSGRRGARHDEGAFLLEGPTLVAEALASGTRLEALYVEDGQEEQLVETARAAGVEVHVVEAGVLAEVSDVVTPRPILAVAPLAPADATAILADGLERGRPVLLLVEVNDPGNLGTILRAAEAAGCAGVLCSRGTVDPWAPKTVRSSAGAILEVPVALDVEPLPVVAEAGRLGLLRAATVVHGGTTPDEIGLGRGCLLVLGSEAHGLSSELVDAVDSRLTIPMDGRAESLNVAMAASVLVFEALRQRRAEVSAPHGDGDARLAVPPSEPIGRPDPSATQ